MFHLSTGSLKQLANCPSLLLESFGSSKISNKDEVSVRLVSRDSPLIVTVFSIQPIQNTYTNVIDYVGLSLDDGSEFGMNAILDESQWQRLDTVIFNNFEKNDLKIVSTYLTSPGLEMSPYYKQLKVNSVILIQEYTIRQFDSTKIINIKDFTIIGERNDVKYHNVNYEVEDNRMLNEKEALELIARAPIKEDYSLNYKVEPQRSLIKQNNNTYDENNNNITVQVNTNAIENDALIATEKNKDNFSQIQDLIAIKDITEEPAVTSKLAPTHLIKDLYATTKKFSILVRLLKKTQITHGNTGGRMRLLFADKTGFIEAVAFREFISHYNLASLELNLIYRISNGNIAFRRNQSYRAWPGVDSVKYDIHIEKGMNIELINEKTETNLCEALADVRLIENNIDSNNRNNKSQIEATIKPPTPITNTTSTLVTKKDNINKLLPLDQICLCANEQKINIIAIIKKIGTIENIEARSYINKLKVRRITLNDTTGVTITCRFYGKDATKINFQVGDILLICKAVVKPYKQFTSISIYRDTNVSILTETSSLPEYISLKNWWIDKQSSDKLRNNLDDIQLESEDKENDVSNLNEPKLKKSKN